MTNSKPASEALAHPLDRVRRTDRAVEDEAWIRAFLRRAPYAAIATSLKGQPFITTRTFVYHEKAQAIYIHGAREGRFATNVAANPQVCVNVSSMGRLIPAQAACEFGVEYAGVTVFGTVHVVEDLAEALQALQLLLDKYFPHLRPGVDYTAVTPAGLERAAVYRIAIRGWSGKQRREAEGFPGAFSYTIT